MTDGTQPITIAISINFRDVEVYATQGDQQLWNVTYRSFGGVDLIFALLQYLRFERDFLIGRHSAEYILMKLSSAKLQTQPLEIKGRDLKSGLPAKLTMSTEEIKKALETALRLLGHLREIFDSSEVTNSWTRERNPINARPALSDQPIVLGGEFGGVPGLAQRLEEVLEHRVIFVDQSEDS